MPPVDFATHFPNMKPVKSPPPLFRINGCGTSIFGRRDFDPQTNTYVTTLCITLLFIPVFALHAYRVAKADRGWYFLGKEPLSVFAKAWDGALFLTIALFILSSMFVAYTSTPAYKAHRQMTEARSLANKGQLAAAAHIYQKLILASADEADNAHLALKDLLDNKCQSVPLAQVAPVLAAAARVTNRTDAYSQTQLAAKGLALIKDKGSADPKGALAVLDTIRPLATDTRDIDQARLPLLQAWFAAEPANLEAAVSLASALEQQNRIADAKKVLLPFKDKLADGEGARVLGLLYVHDGDYDSAYALLWPYAKSRLDALHNAENKLKGAAECLWQVELQILKDDKGPRDFYESLKGASKDQQNAMVNNYINNRIKNNSDLLAAQENFRNATHVVPVALDLGIVMLHRAQAQTDPAARKKQLEATEQVFLSIKGVAGGSDQYLIYLGQVYYWLDKQTEGKKLFDQFLASKKRSVDALLNVAAKYRELGADSETRTLTEEAYSKAGTATDKYAAAYLRSQIRTSLEDEITWVNRSDLANPTINAWHFVLLGHKAFQDGHEDEAARQYQAAIDIYNSLPRNSTTLNETSLAYSALYHATGDRKALDHYVDITQQAVDLEPGNPILIFNAAYTLCEAAATDVVGNSIDLHALHMTGSIQLLAYLYNDQPGRLAIAQCLRNHPCTTRALAYFDKAMTLSPKHARSYGGAYAIRHLLDDEAAISALESHIRQAEIDPSEDVKQAREFISGANDQPNVAAAEVKRTEALCTALRPKGGITAAVALSLYAEALMSDDFYTHKSNPDKILDLALEANRIAPSSSTSSLLSVVYLFRTAKTLHNSEPAFVELEKKYGRSLGIYYLLAICTHQPGSLQQKILSNPDYQKAAALCIEDIQHFPDRPSVFGWAILKNSHPDKAEILSAALRQKPAKLTDQSLCTLLYPANASQAIELAWLFQILNRPDDAKQALQKVSALGIPIPPNP